MSDIQVHLVDDDEAVRRSLSFVFDVHGLAVRTYSSAMDLLQAAPAFKTGCIVTDVRMPEMSGLDLVRKLKEQAIDLPVIMITGHADVPLAVEAMRAGVVDFLEKPFENEALLGAVQMALDAQADHAEAHAQKQRFEKMIASLSPRELEVLRCVVDGKMNKVIAHELGISVRTVEVYRANVMSKTQAKSLSELVRTAMLAGF
jgi:Response regulator